jgi:hypothetical protein
MVWVDAFHPRCPDGAGVFVSNEDEEEQEYRGEDEDDADDAKEDVDEGGSMWTGWGVIWLWGTSCQRLFSSHCHFPSLVSCSRA